MNVTIRIACILKNKQKLGRWAERRLWGTQEIWRAPPISVLLYACAAIAVIHKCSRYANLWPEIVMEHVVGRHGQPRGVQVYAVCLIGWKG